MGAEADAGTVILRLIGDGSSLNKTLRQAEAGIKNFAKVAAASAKAAMTGTKFPSSIELSNKRHEAAIKEREALNKRLKATMKASAEFTAGFMDFKKPNYPRPPEGPKVKYPHHMWTGKAPLGQTDLRSPQARLARHNARIAQREADKAAKFVQPKGKYGPSFVDQQRRLAAVRGVVDRPLDEKYQKRLTEARKIGGPLSIMPGILGKIAAGFIAAGRSKDAFAANVFSKMPPVFMVFKNVASGILRIGKALLSIPSLVGKAIGGLQAFGTKIRTAGIYATALITAPILGFANSALASGSGFDKTMNEAVARAGSDKAGNREISPALRSQMEAQAKSMSVSGVTAFSATELAVGYKELAAAGVKASALLEALPIVTALAQAGQLDLAQTTNYLTQTMGAFGKTTTTITDPKKYAAEMASFSNAMVSVSNATQASVESVAESMINKAAPAAKQYGMTMQELAAIIGTYATAGKLGAQAGTVTTQGIQLLTSSFAKHKDVWKSEGLNIVDTTGKYRPYIEVIGMLNDRMKNMEGPAQTDLLQKLGLRNLSQAAIKPLLGARAEYDRIFAEIGEGGATAKMAAIQMEAFNNQIKVLLYNPLENLNIEIFELFKDILLGGAKAVGEMIKEFEKLDGGSKRTIVILLAGLALLGPILLIIGTTVAIAVAGLSALAGIFSSLGGFLVVSGVLIVGFNLLESVMKNIAQGGFISFWEDLTVSMTKFTNGIPGFLQNFKQNMQTLFKWMSTQDLGAIIKIPLGIIGTTLVGIMVVVGAELLKAIVPVGQFFWELFQGLVQYLYQSLANIRWNPITGSFTVLDPVGKANETYAEEIKLANRIRFNELERIDIQAYTGDRRFQGESRISRLKTVREEWNYAKGVAAGKRDAAIKEATTGSSLVTNLLTATSTGGPDPIKAIGKILRSAGTDMGNFFGGLTLPDFNFDIIKADMKAANDVSNQALDAANEAAKTETVSPGKKKGKLGYGSDNDRIEGAAFGSAEAYSRIMSYAETSGAMIPIERKVDTAEQRQTEIIKLLGEIARNTMGNGVTFNTTNFADA